MICLLAVAALAGACPSRSEAKSYSSGGGHSYSSSSSHSSSSGGSHGYSSGSSHSGSSGTHGASSSGGGSTHTSSSGGSSGPSHISNPGNTGTKTFNSGSGKSYSSGSTGSDTDRHGYSSAKSYSSSPGHSFSPGSGTLAPSRPAESARKTPAEPKPSSLTFDDAAARARKEQASREDFNRYQESQRPTPKASTASAPPRPSDSIQARPPPIGGSGSSVNYSRRAYIPSGSTISSRPVRVYNVYNSYYSRPWVTYRDPYNSFFWWWLLDRSLDDRAGWAYHHRYNMDPARYDALVSSDQQLQERVSQLEAQQAPRDPNFVPAGLDRDLMYSDHYVSQAYGNRPTRGGRAAFWFFGIPLALGVSGFFIWLIWFKRWQTST